MRLRPARPGDAEALWRVHTAAIRETAASHYDAAQREAWAGGLAPARYGPAIAAGAVVVAEAPGAGVVGFATLDPHPAAAPAGAGEVAAVYVAPGHGRRGVGGRLLAAVEAAARRRGLTALRLDASLNAVPFYERAGYRRERAATHRLRGGVELPCVRMGKALPQTPPP